MEQDFINGTVLTIWQDQRRSADAIAFCERLISEVPLDEIRAIVYRNLGDFHFFLTGDGMAARSAYEAGLDILDANMDLVFHSKHYSVEIMKRTYSDLCEGIRPLSLSIDEYEKFALKTKDAGLRGLNAVEQRGLKAIADMRRRNIPWKEDIFSRVGNYINNSGRQKAFGQVASTLSIVLCNYRTLELNRDDLNLYSIPAYVAAIVNIVTDHYNTSVSRREKPDFKQHRFVFKKAIATLIECKNSRLADPGLIDSQIETLRSEMARIERQCQSASGSMAHPTNAEINDEFPGRMEELKNVRFFQDSADSFSCPACGNSMSRETPICGNCGKPITKPQQMGKMPLGCFLPIIFIFLGVAGYYWYAVLIAKTHGVLSWVIAIICSLLFLNAVIVAIRFRQRK